MDPGLVGNGFGSVFMKRFCILAGLLCICYNANRQKEISVHADTKTNPQ